MSNLNWLEFSPEKMPNKDREILVFCAKGLENRRLISSDLWRGASKKQLSFIQDKYVKRFCFLEDIDKLPWKLFETQLPVRGEEILILFPSYSSGLMRIENDVFVAQRPARIKLKHAFDEPLAWCGIKELSLPETSGHVS